MVPHVDPKGHVSAISPGTDVSVSLIRCCWSRMLPMVVKINIVLIASSFHLIRGKSWVVKRISTSQAQTPVGGEQFLNVLTPAHIQVWCSRENLQAVHLPEARLWCVAFLLCFGSCFTSVSQVIILQRLPHGIFSVTSLKHVSALLLICVPPNSIKLFCLLVLHEEEQALISCLSKIPIGVIAFVYSFIRPA